MIRWIDRIKAGLASFSRSRRIKSRMFAGNPLILNIGRREVHGQVNMTLLYRNGLILTLGDKGILDFQDKDFGQFLSGPGFSNREVMTHLHKIVLKSLIRYMVNPGLEYGQRERAAESATKLYLAEVEANRDWALGPAAVAQGSFQEESLVES